MTDATLTRRRQQTQKAREAYAARFTSPEEKAAHYRELGRRAADRRLVLSGDEADVLNDVTEALGEAYGLLRRIARRARSSDNTPPPENGVTRGGELAAQEEAS